jgi:hypothetical protein
MTIALTVDDVRDIIPDLNATDAAITLQISVVGCKVDSCLEANYADCQDVAKAIKIYTVAHFAEGGDNKGDVTSRKYADGDAETYSSRAYGMTSYWETALQLDSAGCVENAFRTRKVFAVTGRTSKYYEDAV